MTKITLKVAMRFAIRSALAALLMWILGVVAWSIKIEIGDNVPVPGIWASPCAVDSKFAYDPLPDMNGNEIGVQHSFVAWCAFTILDHSLIYWSPVDESVCVAMQSGGSRWYSAKRWITDCTDVNSIVSSKKYVYLNIRDQSGPTEVVRLVPQTGQISVVPGVIEIRAHDNSTDVIGMRKDGSLQFYTDDQIAASPPLFVGKGVDWDGDAGAKMVCWRIGHRIMTLENGRSSSFTVDMHRYRGISLYAAKHIIWISSDFDGPAIMDANALVYRYNGSYLGSHLFFNTPANPPMYPSDPIVVKIANRLSVNRKSVVD